MASTCYNIHLYPAFILKNCLPVDIICCGQSIEGEITVKVGDTLQLPNIDPGKSYIVIRVIIRPKIMIALKGQRKVKNNFYFMC